MYYCLLWHLLQLFSYIQCHFIVANIVAMLLHHCHCLLFNFFPCIAVAALVTVVFGWLSSACSADDDHDDDALHCPHYCPLHLPLVECWLSLTKDFADIITAALLINFETVE